MAAIGNALASVFDDPRIAAVRPLIDSTAAGREVSARLERLPVRLVEASRDELAWRGATATYSAADNSITLPEALLNARTAHRRRVLADVVLHEGVHRIQAADGTIFPPPLRLAWDGAAAAVGAVRRGERPAAAWRDAVSTSALLAEGEAYLVGYRAARELGRDVSRANVLREIPAIERSLDRPLQPRDVIPAVLGEQPYRRTAETAQRRARATTAQVGALGLLAGGSVAGISASRANRGE